MRLRQRVLDGQKQMSEADDVVAANTYVETELTRRLKGLETCCDADFIVCIHPILTPFDDLIRDQIEDIKERKSSLFVILETDGGSIETAERIADTFRHHYANGEVSFIVPNFAMSAGTILVMSGDRILMDYYSILGPIDPQIRNKNNQWVPALGYLEKFDQLVNKSKKNNLTQAELAFLLEKFDPAELHRFEQARDHSVDLLEKWLVKYKFKNWVRTETRNMPVTPAMKTQRAKKVARSLNDTKRWRSHGRGLSMEVVSRELGLLIEDFGTVPALDELNKAIRPYYRLMQDYMHRRGYNFAVHTREKLVAA